MHCGDEMNRFQKHGWIFDLIFLIAAVIVAVTLLIEYHPKLPGFRKLANGANWTTKDFQAWYAYYNEKLFYSQLPPDTIIDWADLSNMHAMGATEAVQNGRYLIRIDRDDNRTDVTIRETLIHEMCHIEVYVVEGDDGTDNVKHGPLWQRCMTRIADRGGFAPIW